jgi:hypothetical protein
LITSRAGKAVLRKLDGEQRKAERRLQRQKAKAERIARGEKGPAIDWDAAATGAQEITAGN